MSIINFDFMNFILNPFILLFITAGLGLLFGKIQFGKFNFGSSGALFVGLLVGWGAYTLAQRIYETGDENAAGMSAATQIMESNGGNVINTLFFSASLIIFVATVGLLAAKDLKAIIKKYGHLDILVNNAGITKDGLLMAMSEADFDNVIDTNLKGCFQMIRFASRRMMKQRYGRIINVSSVSGVAGNAGQANYSASKAGIIGLTKSAAKELASRGITCNAIAPGFVKTEMTDVLSDEVKENAKKQIPLGRFAEPEDIANAAVFLASDKASYITGQVLLVDGGMVM